MIKLCLIGNSHAAALKLGWELIKGEFSDLEVTIFAAPGDQMGDLRVKGRRLVPGSSKLRKTLKTICGRGRIKEKDYDRFLVCGMKYGANTLVRLLIAHRLGHEPKDDRQPISLPFFERIAAAQLRSLPSIAMIENLRRITKKPIGLIVQPFCSDHAEWTDAKYIRQPETEQKLAEKFVSLTQDIVASLDCDVFFQPEATKSSPLRTRGEFSIGSRRLSNSNPHELLDIRHMNPDYGAIVWRSILAGSGL